MTTHGHRTGTPFALRASLCPRSRFIHSVRRATRSAGVRVSQSSQRWSYAAPGRPDRNVRSQPPRQCHPCAPITPSSTAARSPRTGGPPSPSPETTGSRSTSRGRHTSGEPSGQPGGRTCSTSSAPGKRARSRRMPPQPRPPHQPRRPRPNAEHPRPERPELHRAHSPTSSSSRTRSFSRAVSSHDFQWRGEQYARPVTVLRTKVSERPRRRPQRAQVGRRFTAAPAGSCSAATAAHQPASAHPRRSTGSRSARACSHPGASP